MPHVVALSETELQESLRGLPGWAISDGKLHKTFRFVDFTAAFGFMSKVAREADALDHHPEWCNVWNKVVIDLVTHSAGNRISQLDVTLAQKIDALAGEAIG